LNINLQFLERVWEDRRF